jgi:hypothetical protein
MRWTNWTALALAISLVACEDVDSSLSVIGVAPSEEDDACVFEPGGDAFLQDIFFDAARTDSLSLALRVRNNLQSAETDFGGISAQEDIFVTPSDVTPLRMDFRFECDVSGFSDELGPLFVPQFSTEKAFCLEKDAREFYGFDVVQASGPAIPPNGGVGIVFVRPITVQLARALGEVFELANLAEACCQDVPGGCSDENLAGIPTNGTDDCGKLQSAFETIAPNSGLSVNEIDDVQKFRPYRIFDWTAPPAPRLPPTGGLGAGYPMRLRGVLEGATGDGSIVSSTEYLDTIHLCANCVSTPCTNL